MVHWIEAYVQTCLLSVYIWEEIREFMRRNGPGLMCQPHQCTTCMSSEHDVTWISSRVAKWQILYKDESDPMHVRFGISNTRYAHHRKRRLVLMVTGILGLEDRTILSTEENTSNAITKMSSHGTTSSHPKVDTDQYYEFF